MPSKYDDSDLHDLMTEEKTRGTRRPQKSVSISQKRELAKIGRMILNRNCTKREYLQAIRDYGPKDGSPEFQRLVSLWDEYHGLI
jgi:hypothetical protein